MKPPPLWDFIRGRHYFYETAAPPGIGVNLNNFIVPHLL
jgi:hypothetical protein